MIRPFHSFSLITLAIAAACATVPPERRGGDPAVAVTARAETAPVGTINEDAADDPAIWRNAEDPAKSLIVGTDKKGGLYVFNLAGRQLSFLPAQGLNNVDLAQLPDGRVLVAASDRFDPETAHVHISVLDKQSGFLEPIERAPVGAGEGYGICLSEPDGEGYVEIFSAPKNGVIYSLSYKPGAPAAAPRTLTSVPSQPEGCVVDDRTGTLYVGEELAGIWAIDIASGEKRLVAPTGTGMTVPDVEGLAIAPEGEKGGYLVASSQGDNAFAVYRLPGVEPLGRFRISEGAFGSVEETDGIELDPRSFGPDFPGGLFVAQDGVNPPAAQNFKLARWDEILAALEAARNQVR
ncbi:MAG: phytase [Erythrobacter sp.]|uniref:phytase n=1 Tax=Erythrobacter sp. TaxID=1042 RepID=UPI00260F7828|nr:phytase [Erythrobacter sp.]MDJ0979060.1 phytase [Erythrobacter sp.]